MKDRASSYMERSVVLWRVKSEGDTEVGEGKIRQLGSGKAWSIGGGSRHKVGGKCENARDEREIDGNGVEVTEMRSSGPTRTRS